MKRFVIFSLIIAMVSGAAFAQLADGISVNAWGRAAFSPLRLIGVPQENGESNDDDKSTLVAGGGASWGGESIRADFRIQGNSDYVGFAVGTNSESGEVGSNDLGYNIWAKPFANDWLKLTAGKFVDDTLRGKVGGLDGGFANFALRGDVWDGNVPEEDSIFTRFVGGRDTTKRWDSDIGTSFMLSSAPIDGLFIGLVANGALDPWWNNGIGGTESKYTYRFMQIGAGYNIEGIGHLRAQWIGGFLGTEKKADDDNYVEFDFGKPARIEAAFALTAVDNLLIDLGAKFWMPVEREDAKKVSNGVMVSLGATFRMEAFALGARIDSGFASYDRGDNGVALKDDKSGDGADIAIRLAPSYDFDAFTLGLHVGARIVGAGKAANGDALENNWTQFGFGGYIGKGLGSGSVKAGLSFTTAPIGKDGANGSTVFQIPVILEYAFF